MKKVLNKYNLLRLALFPIALFFGMIVVGVLTLILFFLVFRIAYDVTELAVGSILSK